MTIQGLNITIDIRRRTETTDAVGGAIYTEAAVSGASGVRARLGNASRGAQQTLKEMGFETTRAHQIVAQPSDLNVRENDLILIHGGHYDGQEMIVRLAKKDSLPSGDSRSHVELLVERLVAARSEP